jgi:hypothetical protein
MTSKNLKLLSGYLVMESDSSDSAKKQLLNFIKDANVYQLKAFILNDEIENLDEDSYNIIEKRFNILENEVFQELDEFETITEDVETVAKAALATVIGGPAGLILYGAYKLYQRYMTKAGIACRNAINRRTCRKQYKINAIKLQIKELEKGISKCSKAKNPEKCKSAVEKKIKQLEARLAGTAQSAKQRSRED